MKKANESQPMNGEPSFLPTTLITAAAASSAISVARSLFGVMFWSKRTGSGREEHAQFRRDQLRDGGMALGLEMDPVEVRVARRLAEVDELQVELLGDGSKPIREHGRLGRRAGPVLTPRRASDRWRAGEDR